MVNRTVLGQILHQCIFPKQVCRVCCHCKPAPSVVAVQVCHGVLDAGQMTFFSQGHLVVIRC